MLFEETRIAQQVQELGKCGDSSAAETLLRRRRDHSSKASIATKRELGPDRDAYQHTRATPDS
jgi:hypothetical protein